MMRVCHLNTCPVGIATQNPELRKRFTGKPEFVENFFQFIAEEVREYLAALGLRSIEEAVGRVDLLDTVAAIDHYKAQGLDLGPVLATPDVGPPTDRYCSHLQDHGLDKALDHRFLDACRPVIEAGGPPDGRPLEIEMLISNVDRTVGALLGYEITTRHGGAGLPDDSIVLTFVGSAGQSFGAFVPRGVTLRLIGDANDYLAKGLSGGRVVVRPDESSPFAAEEQIIAGNVILYGATSGEAFIRGQVGERFCVRNSGATAVVEGVGDHGCEYMTGGRVVVLGATGRNFGAGMSGGIAYIYDPDGTAVERVNLDMVAIESLDAEDRQWLVDIVARHQSETDSAVAERLLASWGSALGQFVKIMPADYRRVLEATRLAVEEGRSVDDAVMAAAHG
jgi:glutamate synthase (NADPH) large chain